MSKPTPKQNNHKADIKNSNNTTLNHNNKTYKAATDNHVTQKNPNQHSSKGKK
jgi:hypothetical protein